MTDLQKIDYSGWANSYRLSNQHIELVVTTDLGPRIIHFGFAGGENEFHVFPEFVGKGNAPYWHPYGGHRLWHAPEQNPRTYYPDNAPVCLEQHSDFIRVIQPIEDTTRIEKEMDIYMAADAPHVRIVHRLRNHNAWPVTFAVWSISIMAPNGTGIMPLPPRGPQPESLLPTSNLAMWPYTDMRDPRWTWGFKYIILRQDPAYPDSQKTGLWCLDGWIAYARNNHLFVVMATPIPGVPYPDFGCNIETYANGDMLEVETLGPLTTVEPGSAIEHTERWALLDGIPTPTSDDDIDTHIRPKIEALLTQNW